ncbi:hypothetical protein [Niabella ginsengisoli]|uniref:Uncharacterized protein n=1 Tax=Niabella ginsengisoli TaxID=522298 RepID=A0ABS9SNA4_9BACT|nr:hypothetical protein [Niabella ginsengisoli]MCH5599857.1 hypothetical protein [Niabella ginsengisoli]
MKKLLLIAAFGLAINAGNIQAQTSNKKETKEEKEKPAKKKETSEERVERKKEDMRRFGRSQRDFWKGEHEKRVAEKRS